MPFDFKAYDAKCNGLTPEELQREWEHYTRLISGASTSTAVSGLAVPFTLGVSTIGVAMAAPAIHNARKKRQIIENHLQKHGATHVTRKRDVLGSMAVSGTIGVVTLGVASGGADVIATAGAEHGVAAVVENEMAIKVVTHAALDGVGLGIEHAHTNHLKKKDAFKAFQKAGVFKAVKDAKAAEAGYSIQPYNPQTYASGSTATYAPPQPQYAYGSPMSPPPSYSATPGYASPLDPKAPAPYGTNPQVQNYAMPSPPSQQQVPPEQYNPSSGPYHQTAPSASLDPTSTVQPYSSYYAQPSPTTQSASTSPPGVTQQYPNPELPYLQSAAGSSNTTSSRDAYNMGALAQSLPATSTVASAPVPAPPPSPQPPHGGTQVPQRDYTPHAHHTSSQAVASQSPWHPATNQQPAMGVQTSYSLAQTSGQSHHHQYPGHSSQPHQHNPQTLLSPPSSTSYSTTPSQVPLHHQPTPPAATPAATYALSATPKPHQAYQPSSWNVPPPPPYPPPQQNAAQNQQQQTTSGAQYAPVPGNHNANSSWGHPAYHQTSQATGEQHQYPSVSHPYQPQYQTQQQGHQVYNPPPTPLSPPHGTLAVQQGGSGYFPAMANAQDQNFQVQKGSVQPQPQGQGPYTPAATPGVV